VYKGLLAKTKAGSLLLRCRCSFKNPILFEITLFEFYFSYAQKLNCLTSIQTYGFLRGGFGGTVRFSVRYILILLSQQVSYGEFSWIFKSVVVLQNVG
jgi:hypothetical protein